MNVKTKTPNLESDSTRANATADALARDRFETPEIWTEVARDYTELVLPAFELYAKQALGRLPTHPSARVLDLACGPGTLTTLVAPLVAGVDAVDFSSGMLAMLERRVSARHLGNVTAHLMDGHCLGFASDTFDAACSLFGLVHFSDAPKALREVFRVCKPGGKLLLSTWGSASESEVQGLSAAALRAALPELPSDTQLFHGVESAEVWVDAISHAGFADASMERVSFDVELPSAAGYWANMLRASVPVVLLRNHLPAKQWQQVSERALRYLESEYSWPHSCSISAYLFEGTKPVAKR